MHFRCFGLSIKAANSWILASVFWRASTITSEKYKLMWSLTPFFIWSYSWNLLTRLCIKKMAKIPQPQPKSRIFISLRDYYWNRLIKKSSRKIVPLRWGLVREVSAYYCENIFFMILRLMWEIGCTFGMEIRNASSIWSWYG